MISESANTHDLTEIHTGGTTGRALSIWCDRAALQLNYAFFERLKRWAGVGERDLVATFAGRPIVSPERTRPPFWRRNFAGRQILFSSYHISRDTAGAYLAALERFGPLLIDSYPSSIEPIAREAVRRGGSRLRPTAVITSSETLLPDTRELIEEAFACPVFDHYGSAEMVAFITQCERGRYHPNPEYGYVEILRPDGSPASPGEEGEIVATGLINRVMPLIRYRMGDLAVASDDACPCGRAYPVVEQIVGRLDDVIVTPEGRRVGRLDPIFKAAGTLHEARLVQTHLDRVRLEIVPGADFSERDRESLLGELRLRLGGAISVEVREVADIPRTGRGKLRTVVSELDGTLGNDPGEAEG